MIDKVNYKNRVNHNLALLSEELPNLFKVDISYNIYTKNIIFKDPVNQFKGKFFYRVIFWTLRFHAQLFFREIYFDLHEIKSTAKDIIRADWTVRGKLRVPWQNKIFFNGYSTYRINQEGLIYEHIDTWDRSPQEILKQFVKVEG